MKVLRFNTDTGGLTYHRAINQLFIGLYVMQLYLAVLFFLVRDENGGFACIGQGAMMVLVLLCTWTYQNMLNQAYKPLLKQLPLLSEDQIRQPFQQRESELERPSWLTSARVKSIWSRFELITICFNQQLNPLSPRWLTPWRAFAHCPKAKTRDAVATKETLQIRPTCRMLALNFPQRRSTNLYTASTPSILHWISMALNLSKMLDPQNL